MGQPLARIGDIVTGYCNGPGHPSGREFVGTWSTGSSVVTADGIGVVRVGDVGTTDCGHTFVAITGSPLSNVDDISVHRVGDVVATEGGGVGTTVTGSNVTTSD